MKKALLAFGFLPMLAFGQMQKDTLAHIRGIDLQTNAVTNTLPQAAVKKLGGNAPGLLRNLAGVTISGGQASFRGLSPRYTNVTIDGLSAPVSEQNIKSFSLNLLPRTSMQALSVFRSGDFANHGEWGGGSIQIFSDADVAENWNTISVSMAYQYNITGNDFYQGIEQGDHYFGFGAEDRRFQNDVVNAATLQTYDRSQAAAEGTKLRQPMEIDRITAAPSYNINYQMGRVLLNDGEKRLTTINSISFNKSMNGAHYNRRRFSNYESDESGEVISSELRNFMTDGVYVTSTNWELNSAWKYQLNKDNALNLDVIYSKHARFSTLTRYFISLASQKEAYFAQYGLTDREMIQTRLSGDHTLNPKTKIEWSLGYGIFDRTEPDLRRLASQRPLGGDSLAYLLLIPDGSKADAGSRFGSDMTDNNIGGRVDLMHNLIPEALDLRVGLLYETTDRDFQARLLTTAKDDLTRPELRFVEFQNYVEAYQQVNFEGDDGYFLVDGTTPFETYTADNALFGGYIGVDWHLSRRWTTSIGARVESFQQNLQSGDVDVEQNNTNLLPTVSFNFSPDRNNAIKFGYTSSVNRPAFRELAPFIFYDFDYRANILGNPDLENATLHHLDVSWLHAFGRNESVTMSAFYKRINNPIEMVYTITSDNPQFSFNNAKGADLAGFEVEFTKFLSSIERSFLNRLLLSGSLAYTYSLIELSENSDEVASNRPLQGQTPLLLKAGVNYIHPNKFFNIGLQYQYTGRSLYSVGDGLNSFPWYNAPVNMLNAKLTLNFSKQLSLSLAAVNLLNAAMPQIEDTNLNAKINDPVDQEVQNMLIYQTYVLNLKYRF